MPVKILVIDDQEVVAAGVARLLQAAGHEVHYAGDVDGALEGLASEPPPDLVLLDVHLGSVHASEVVPQLLAVSSAKVLLLTGDDDPGLVSAALRVGALGVVRKTARPDELLQAVLVAASGGAVLSTSDIGTVLAQRPRQGDLTGREHEILLMMDAGMSTSAMASRLVLSEHTVRGHVQNVLRKLGADSRLAALAAARRKGLLGGQG